MATGESVKSRLQAHLNEFSALTRQLLEVIGGETKPGVNTGGDHLLSSVLDKLVERDREIQQLTETALEMRSRQREMDQVETELERRTQEISELQTRLQDAEKILELAVYHGKQKLESARKANEGAIPPEELIQYAHRISQASSTVSPVGWQPSDPRRPYPQDIEMRSGALGQLGTPSSQQGAKPSQQTSKPQEKAATESASMGILSGVNQNNNKAAAGQGAGNPFGPGARNYPAMTFEEPETMSEDSSPSSSDEGT